MQKVKKFISYYGPYKAIFYLDMFCALVLSIIDLVFPMLVQYLLDEVYGKRPPNMVDIILISGLGLLVLYIIRYFVKGILLHKVILWEHAWKRHEKGPFYPSSEAFIFIL